MQALVLFSHGSVLCGAERNLLELGKAMRERGDASFVEVAFLNYLRPDLTETVSRCVALGTTSIVVVPYFLIAGKFVTEDLPLALANARAAHPSIPIAVADVIGFHPAMVDAVIEAIETARPSSGWNERVEEAGAACREEKRCPLYGSEVCKARIEMRA